MDINSVNKLRDALIEASPVDTGQLRDSIQAVQLDAKTYVITIGNGTTQTRRTPSNVYASITNNSKYLKIPTGKRGESSLRKLVRNPNYHWVNNVLDSWVKTNVLNIANDILEDEE